MAAKTPKNQHYVPQFLLRAFSFGKNEYVHVFEKPSRRIFETGIRNVAAENGFYNLRVARGIISIDPALEALENDTAAILKRVRKRERLADLTHDERETVALFTCVQMVRTRAYRELISDLARELRIELYGNGNPAAVPTLSKMETPDGAKAFAMQSVIEAGRFVPLVLNKDWLLLRAEQGAPFYISDNPVSLQNIMRDGPRGGLGLGVPGIEVYLPLSPSLALAFYCKTYREKCEELTRRTTPLVQRLPDLASMFRDGTDAAEAYLGALDRDEPMPYPAGAVVNFNSLQVISAERFVFSSKKDFSLALEMVTTDVETRRGPRMEFM